MNETLFQRLEGICVALLGGYQSGRGMAASSRGQERQAFVDGFLRKVFPAHFRFGLGGTITDSTGRTSGETDIVMETPFWPSIPTTAADVRLYCAEGVLAVIEIKSDLRRQWHQVEATTRKVKALVREMTPILPTGARPPAEIPVFGVGYTGYQTHEHLLERLGSTDAHARPDGLLVIDSGCVAHYPATAGKLGPWGLWVFIAWLNNLCGAIQLSTADLSKYAPSDEVHPM